MSAAVGPARLPRALAASLEETGANLHGAANDLDGLLFAAPPAVAALEARDAGARRIRHDVHAHVAVARRTGPDRLRLIALADDERVALCAERLLDRMELALRSCVELRQTLLRHALA